MKIAVFGKMASGKTYISKSLALRYNLEIYSFGDKVKELAKELFMMKDKDRKLLQILADKMKEINPDVWVNYLIEKIKDKDNVIIDDLRFPDEALELENLGFTIIGLDIDQDTQLKRLKKKYPQNYHRHLENLHHTSEIQFKNIDADFRIYSNEKTLATIIKFLETDIN
uniref:Uncharacterized protein n=1 Tax=viral metagenome TaxID=1070528 RepID=A0A6C0J110_9ZZZZ